MSDETKSTKLEFSFELTRDEYVQWDTQGKKTWEGLSPLERMDYTERWLEACVKPLYQKYHELKAENEGLTIMVKGFEERLATTDQGSTEPQPQPVVANVTNAEQPLEVAEEPVMVAEAITEVVAAAEAPEEDADPVIAEVAPEDESRGKLPKPAVTQSDTADKELLTFNERLKNNTGSSDRTPSPRSQKNQRKYDTVRDQLSRPPEGQPDWVARGVTAAIIIAFCTVGYFLYSTYKQNKTDNKQATQQRISTLPAEIVATVDKSKLVWLREQNTCKEVLKQLPKTRGFEKVRLRISFVKKLKTASKLTQHHALATCWLTANFANQKVKQVRNYLFKLEKNNGKYPNGVAVSATTIKKGKEPLLYLEKVQGMKKLFTSHDSKDSLGTATVGYFQVRVEKPGWFDWLWN